MLGEVGEQRSRVHSQAVDVVCPDQPTEPS